MTPPTRIRLTSDQEMESARSHAAGVLAGCLEEIEHFTRDRLTAACREHPSRADAIRERMKTLRAAGMTARLDRSPSAQTFRPGAASLANGEETGSFEPIGPYQPLKEIGRGGQALVYLAEDLRLHRPVALKILRGFGPVPAEVMRRFRREAEVASRLDHPGICAVYDAGVERGIPYIAMRYVEGESLAAKIAAARKNGAPIDKYASAGSFVDLPSAGKSPPGGNGAEAPPPSGGNGAESPRESETGSLPTGANTRAELLRVVTLIERTARALHAAHEAGIVHRDVKPGNIMVTPTAEPVLLDFGLAGEVAGELSAFTRSGDFFGTPAYMSPEQLLAHRIGLDRRTDVYSLGATFYECVTLRRPFEAPSRQALYHAIQFKDSPNPRRLNPLVPADLKVVLDKAMEKDRDRRYPTAEAFADDLRRVQEGQPITARPVSATGRGIRWAKRRPFRAALLLTLLIGLPLVAGLGAYVITAMPEAWARAHEEQLESYLEEGFTALADHQNGSNKQAIDWFERALDVEPTCLEAIVGKAVALYGEKRYQDCLAFLDTHHQLEKAHPVLLRLRWRLLSGLKRHAEPEALEKKGLPDPTTAFGHFIDGLTCLKDCSKQRDRAKFQSAHDALRKAALFSRHRRLVYLHQWAHAAGHLKDEKAIRTVVAALRTAAPKSAKAWWWAGWALEKISIEEAIAAYRQALDLRKDFAGAYAALGRLLRLQGHTADGIALHRRAVAIDPESWSFHNSLAVALEADKQDAEALRVYQRAVELGPNESLAHRNLGRLLLPHRRFDESIRSLRAAVGADPKSALAHAYLAWALESKQGLMNLSVEAVEDVLARQQEAIRLDPECAFAHFHIGCILLKRKGDYTGALSAFERAIELMPDDAPARLNLGVVRECLGQFDAAIAAYRKALRIDQSLDGAHYRLGILLNKKQRIDEAITHFREAVRLDPKNPVYLCDLAEVYLLRTDYYDLAIESCRKALQLDPDQVTARTLLACAYLQSGRYQAFEEQLLLVLKSAAADHNVYHNIGTSISIVADAAAKNGIARDAYEEAVRFYLTAVHLKSDNPGTHRSLARAYMRLGRFEDEIAALEQALEFDPEHAETNFRLGFLVHERLEDAERAIALFLRATHSDPSRALYWANLAVAYNTAKRLAPAMDAAAKALALDDKCTTAWSARGMVLRRMGRVDEAITCFEQANAIQPDFATHWANLGDAYRENRNYERAIRAYRQAIERSKYYQPATKRFKIASCHAYLGQVLELAKRGEEAIQVLEEAVVQFPEFAPLQLNYAAVINNQTHDHPTALVHQSRAIELDPDNPLGPVNLAIMLFSLGRFDRALAVGRKAIDQLAHSASTKGLQSRLIAHQITGHVLLESGEVRQARDLLESGLSLPAAPWGGVYYSVLADVLADLGSFRESLAMLRRAGEKGPRSKGVELWARCLPDRVLAADRLVKLEGRVDSFLRGDQTPEKPEDCALLASLLQAWQEHAAATRFFTAAFTRDPALALHRKPFTRYRVDAARSAVLAGTGRGRSRAGLTLPERARLRGQALVWLEAQFTYLLADMIPPQDAVKAMQPGRYEVLSELRRWQVHTDFAGVRDGSDLSLLPGPEREQWFAFWHRVEVMAEMLDDALRSSRSSCLKTGLRQQSRPGDSPVPLQTIEPEVKRGRE